MMHGHEKSDPVIVAVKPANKAERSAAELVERRVGTKGNASQQSTHQTQSWTARVTCAETHTASCRHLPKVGAGCGKAARPDLCGGREVTRVPTAKTIEEADPAVGGRRPLLSRTYSETRTAAPQRPVPIKSCNCPPGSDARSPAIRSTEKSICWLNGPRCPKAGG